jgi:hypothetical protein
VKLGYRHQSWNRELWLRFKEGDLETLFQVAEQFDSFDDGPWNNKHFYQDLDRRFPGSKFILSEREPASWVRSHEAHFTAQNLRERPYLIWRRRYSETKKREVLERYLERNRQIKAYFEGRPDDFLVMNVCGGEEWAKLCPFLGVPLVEEPFPRSNVTEQRPKTTLHTWKRIIADWNGSLRPRARRVLLGGSSSQG